MTNLADKHDINFACAEIWGHFDASSLDEGLLEAHTPRMLNQPRFRNKIIYCVNREFYQ